MDEYKKIFRHNSVIMAPLCFWIFFSTVISYLKINKTLIPYAAILLIAATFLALCAFIRFTLYLGNRLKKFFALLTFIIIFSFIFSYIHFNVERITSQKNLPSNISGFLAEITEVEVKRYNQQLLFSSKLISGKKIQGILVCNSDTRLDKGSIIAVHKKLKLLTSGTNSFNEHLIREGIHYRGFLNDSDFTIIKKGAKSVTSIIRDRISLKINTTFTYPSSGLMQAIYFGDTTLLDKKTIIEFRNAGVLHVLAASGMNIAFVASIPLLLIFTGIKRRKLIIASALLATAYLLITDMPISLIRAWAMYIFVVITIIMNRGINPFNSLYLAGSLIILLMPWEIFNPGFQLSFGATGGILLFYKRYQKTLNGLPAFLQKSMAVSFSAQVFAYPIIFFQMNQFNSIGFLTNLLIIPLTGIFAIISLFILIGSTFFAAASSYGVGIVDLLCRCILFINEFASAQKLNFYSDNELLIVGVMLLLVIPLINIKFFNKMKAFPVFLSLVISTAILKYSQYKFDIMPEILQYTGSKIYLSQRIDDFKIKLNYSDSDDINNDIFDLIRKKNPEIKIIEISDTSYQNITACRILLSDFIIEECIIHNIKVFDNNFKNFIYMLQKENIKITFNSLKES